MTRWLFCLYWLREEQYVDDLSAHFRKGTLVLVIGPFMLAWTVARKFTPTPASEPTWEELLS